LIPVKVLRKTLPPIVSSMKKLPGIRLSGWLPTSGGGGFWSRLGLHWIPSVCTERYEDFKVANYFTSCYTINLVQPCKAAIGGLDWRIETFYRCYILFMICKKRLEWMNLKLHVQLADAFRLHPEIQSGGGTVCSWFGRRWRCGMQSCGDRWLRTFEFVGGKSILTASSPAPSAYTRWHTIGNVPRMSWTRYLRCLGDTGSISALLLGGQGWKDLLLVLHGLCWQKRSCSTSSGQMRFTRKHLRPHFEWLQASDDQVPAFPESSSTQSILSCERRLTVCRECIHDIKVLWVPSSL
jgi:hypothetical protein